jgi:endoglucanase
VSDKRIVHPTWLAAAVTVALLTAACATDGGADPAAVASLASSTTGDSAPRMSATAAPDADAQADSVTQASITGGLTAFFNAGSTADGAVVRLRAAGRAADADLIQQIADQPTAIWLGEWTPDVTGTVRSVTQRAASASEIALFAVYNVPGRDCGAYSAGGASVDSYLAWVQRVADGVAPDAVAWFIVEPDALAQLGGCDGQGDRAGLLAQAARILDEGGGRVFVDVGHSRWNSAQTMAERLEMVGIEHVAGFATNTSNYHATADEVAWGTELAGLIGLPFITDTSRNGNGATSDGEWCNPRGRAIGEPPHLIDAEGPFIATVWAKIPGESDGICNGGPAAGAWWDEVALELAGEDA